MAEYGCAQLLDLVESLLGGEFLQYGRHKVDDILMKFLFSHFLCRWRGESRAKDIWREWKMYGSNESYKVDNVVCLVYQQTHYYKYSMCMYCMYFMYVRS